MSSFFISYVFSFGAFCYVQRNVLISIVLLDQHSHLIFEEVFWLQRISSTPQRYIQLFVNVNILSVFVEIYLMLIIFFLAESVFWVERKRLAICNDFSWREFLWRWLVEVESEASNIQDESLLRYCFSSAYIVSMLHDSLGVALDDQRLKNLLHNLFGFGFRQINYVMFFCLQSRVCKWSRGERHTTRLGIRSVYTKHCNSHFW